MSQCVNCGAVEDPENDIRLRLIEYDDGYSELLCSVCRSMPMPVECCVCGREVREGSITLAEYVERHPGGVICDSCNGYE